jgi:molybdenum cofactor cytidylyltransferase
VIAALVLAAGLGARMGVSKPLLDIDGTPALSRVLATIDTAELRPVIVVLGWDADLIASRIDLRSRTIVRNSLPERGLSSSLTLGLGAVPAACSGALVFHADMPYLHPKTVFAVSALAEAGAFLAAPSFRGVRGFPVFLSRECFDDLRRELSGDSGAKAYIGRHHDALRIVEVADGGCVRDLDRPEDLVLSREELSWTTSA